MASVERQLKDFERSLVQVLVNGRPSGTGVVLAPGWVLTCQHVLRSTAAMESNCSRPEKLDLGAGFSIRFVAGKGRADENTDSEIAEDGNAPEHGTCSGVADPNIQKVTVHTDNLDNGRSLDLVLLRWRGTLPDGVSVAVFSMDKDQEGTEFHCRGFPDAGRLRELLAPGTVTGDVDYDNHSHWQLKSDNIRGGLSGAPLYAKDTGKVIGLVRANVKPSEDFRNLTTAHGIRVDCIVDFLRSVPELASLHYDEAHAMAESRLDDEVKKVLDGDPEFSSKLATLFSMSPDLAEPQTLTARVKTVPIRQLAKSFIELEKNLLTAGDSARARKATNLYYAILSQVLNPVLVREKRNQILQSDGEPGVLLIPCKDRAVLELIFAGIDGRTVAFAYRGSPKSLQSRNEILLDDLPEAGIDQKPDEVAEFLRNSLRLDTIQLLSATSLPDRIRTELDWRRDDHDCVFAVIRGYSSSGKYTNARQNTEVVLRRDYAKILLVDATENGSARQMQAYGDALQPINRNKLLPESSHDP